MKESILIISLILTVIVFGCTNLQSNSKSKVSNYFLKPKTSNLKPKFKIVIAGSLNPVGEKNYRKKILALVEKYNNLLETYKKDLKKYNSSVTLYNQAIARYNLLIRQ